MCSGRVGWKAGVCYFLNLELTWEMIPFHPVFPEKWNNFWANLRRVKKWLPSAADPCQRNHLCLLSQYFYKGFLKSQLMFLFVFYLFSDGTFINHYKAELSLSLLPFLQLCFALIFHAGWHLLKFSWPARPGRRMVHKAIWVVQRKAFFFVFITKISWALQG